MRKWISLVVLLLAGAGALAQQAVAPAAPFGDPERRAKLATAFADIDKILGDYARSVHAPGAAWGIVIDGELAHQGATGRARRRREGARRCRHGLPHRVDDQELHGDVDPQAARRGQAVARRSRRTVRPGAEEPALPDDGLAADHHPPPAHALGRLSRRQPVGRSAALRERGGAVAHAARGHSVLERAGHRLRVLELRVRDSRPHRVARLGQAVRRVRHRQHPQAARHDVDDAPSVEGRAEPARHRVSLGRRAVEGGAGAPARVFRRHGRHADLRSRPQPLRGGIPRRVAAARRARDGPDSPGIAARDAAALAPVRHARRPRQVDERHAADVDELRLRPERDADLPVSRAWSRTAAACPGTGR